MSHLYFWTVRIQLCCFERLAAKNSKLGGGKLFCGMITTLFRGHPELYLHTLVRRHHTVFQKQTLLRRGWGFKGVDELLPRTAGIFVFDVYKMLRFRF